MILTLPEYQCCYTRIIPEPHRVPPSSVLRLGDGCRPRRSEPFARLRRRPESDDLGRLWRHRVVLRRTATRQHAAGLHSHAVLVASAPQVHSAVDKVYVNAHRYIGNGSAK